MCVETDTASFPWKGSYPGFPAFKLQAGQFPFWFSLPASLPPGATAATAFCLVCAASRRHVQAREAAAGWQGLKRVQA